MPDKERIRQIVADLIYARVGWTNASEGASVDITDFILADRRRVLDEVAKPLKEERARHDAMPKYGLDWAVSRYRFTIDNAIKAIEELKGKV